MCGITGFINFTREADPIEISRFNHALRHRGPDSESTYVDGDVALGHTRLAILDLSPAGACPMKYLAPNGLTYFITFNGEVYNFLELRAQLIEKGHVFSSDTDTEVIVAAYAEWGEKCQERFNGMWAFAIWNSQSRELFLSRDRFGIKPLYFLVSDRFAFASELKAFLALDGFSPNINDAMFRHAMTNVMSYQGDTSESLLSGVYRLPGGHCLTVKPSGSVDIKRWWDTSTNLVDIPKTYGEQVEKFRELFLDAVRIRMRSDVSVGTCLSGGVDSSAVASSMHHLMNGNLDQLARCSKDWQQTFIAEFPGTVIDERAYADVVVKHIGAQPNYYSFDADAAIEDLVRSVWALDEITGAVVVPVLATYRTMRERKVVVSLDGHGSDELLCGYGWYLDWPYAHVNQNLYNDFHTNILPGILRNFDRCSMASGIEVRMPFMDYRLVTYAFSLPVESKIGGGWTKRILRDAMVGIMPEQIRTRRNKIGFNAPMDHWMNGSLGAFIISLTEDELWKHSPYFDGPKVARELRDRTGAQNWGTADWDFALKVWTCAQAVLWQKLFLSGGYRDFSSTEVRA